MTMPLQMIGHDRTYRPSRTARLRASRTEQPDELTAKVAAGEVTGWDLFALETSTDTAAWAQITLDGLIASIDAEAEEARGCTDCQDTGFYGLADADDSDLLVGLVHRVGDSAYERLSTEGVWEQWNPDTDLEVLDLDTAGDLAAALTAGACGLLRRYCWPKAFLPPDAVVAASMVSEVISQQDPSTPHGEWVIYGLVDPADVGAVLDVVRIQTGPELAAERLIDGEWTPDEDLILAGEAAVVPLPEPILAALVADAPLTVSPNPKAEKLRRYWSSGRGAAKIRWGTKGDWRRCYRQLRKHMGLRAKGYCQNLHKRNNGYWTGDRRNRGLLSGGRSIEESLLAAVRTGQWTAGETKEGTDMTNALLEDGIYCEATPDNDAIIRTITAGGFPVKPPDGWYENPQLDGPTPMTVDDDGRVYGHIATWDVAHIGMAGGATYAPRSRTNYAYFLTGSLQTESGKQVNVGQLTLAGGHASLQADHGAAVKHYDDTASAVADVTVGEDSHGIWAAGSLRPSVTPEQIRIFRASPLSGDWRPIRGSLELVAACAVNVPGFPITRARVAGGAVVALVAAGARPLAVLRASLIADAALVERVASLEARLDPPVAEVVESVPAVEPEPEPVAEVVESAEPVENAVVTPEDVETTEQAPEAQEASTIEDAKIAARAEVEAIQRQMLRESVGALTASTTVVERRGGGYPIKDRASLKDAIQAFGRSKPEDRAKTRAHIMSAAKKLHATDLIPTNWK